MPNSGHGSREVGPGWEQSQDRRRSWGGTDLEEQESREEITGVSETL